MAVTFVVVPQWQGSVSPRAMRLADGAAAILGDLPSSATLQIEVPVESGDALGTGILRFSAVQRVRELQLRSLATVPDWALTIGGDCGVSLASIEHASRKHGGTLAVVWLDAHPDLNAPETSPSGAFTGMVLRAISATGLADHGLASLTPDAAHVVPPARIVLGGIRDVDPGEAQLIAEHGIALVDASSLHSAAPMIEAVRATGATQVYVHIDLDVLDPSVIAGLANPVPFGLSLEELTGLITALRAEFGLAGATIAGFSPASALDAEEDLPSILRVIGALTR